jgi:L-aspartate oxidase
LVWQSAGICREQSSLEKAISNIESWQAEFVELKLSKFLFSLHPPKSARLGSSDAKQLLLWTQVRNLLDIAYLILKSAAYRIESRGGHYRLDYPDSDPSWQVHTLVQNHHWWKEAVISDKY